MSETILSKSAFATRHGIARSRVTELLGEGLPQTPDGRIEAAAGDAWMRENLSAARRAVAVRRKQVASGGPGAAQRARKLDQENELLALDLARKRGALIDRAETMKALTDFATLHRDAWLGWIARTTPAISAAGSEPAAVFAALDKAVRDHLAELARMPAPEIGNV